MKLDSLIFILTLGLIIIGIYVYSFYYIDAPSVIALLTAGNLFILLEIIFLITDNLDDNVENKKQRRIKK